MAVAPFSGQLDTATPAFSQKQLSFAVDSANFFVQSQDVSVALLNITATATSTQNSPDQINTLHKGVCLFLNVLSVAATTTLALNVQGKDPVSGNYVTIGRLSLDGQVTNATGPNMIQVYPGLATQVSLGGQIGTLDNVLPATWRVQASITATASQAGAGVSFSVSQSRVL